jgi:hypothetical protein
MGYGIQLGSPVINREKEDEFEWRSPHIYSKCVLFYYFVKFIKPWFSFIADRNLRLQNQFQ